MGNIKRRPHLKINIYRKKIGFHFHFGIYCWEFFPSLYVLFTLKFKQLHIMTIDNFYVIPKLFYGEDLLQYGIFWLWFRISIDKFIFPIDKSVNRC